MINVRRSHRQAQERSSPTPPRRARTWAYVVGVLVVGGLMAVLILPNLSGRAPRHAENKAAFAPGHLAAAPRNAGGRRVERLLEGNGIGSVKFGDSPKMVATQLGRMFGRPISVDRKPNGYGDPVCGYETENWRGLGASSDRRLFVVELTALFRHSRFVGYTYGGDNSATVLSSWAQYANRPIMLETARGLRIGDTVAQARSLYAPKFALKLVAQGTPPDTNLSRERIWKTPTSTGLLQGSVSTTALVRRDPGATGGSRWTSVHHSIYSINAGQIPDPPCPAKQNQAG